MSTWDEYPADYRNTEIELIRRAVCAGDCVEIIGLSGSGKSNLVGYLAYRTRFPPPCPHFVLVDCNRLGQTSPEAFFRLMLRSLESDVTQASPVPEDDDFSALERGLESCLSGGENVCMLFDRFDRFYSESGFDVLASNLRALRDAHKYHLTYVIVARAPLDPRNELAELFFGHSTWLGPLSKSDALWSAKRDALRFRKKDSAWSEETLERLVSLSWGYPSLLRAVCEAYADGAELTVEALRIHPAVQRRAAEFWADAPTSSALAHSHLQDHPFLVRPQAIHESLPEFGLSFDLSLLTAKENLLLEYLRAHPDQVCEKDDLVRAIWPEDVIFAQGVRDESLAQLVRRLRVKIEPDPAEPRYIQTIPGRGYRLRS